MKTLSNRAGIWAGQGWAWAMAALLLVSTMPASTATAGDKAMGLDLVGLGIEVTQVVQTLDHDVTLVTGKNTWARVYAKAVFTSGASSIDGVTARLVASRIAPGPVTFLGSIDSEPVTIGTSGDGSRLNSGRSFDFNLPASWRQGTVQMVAVVDFHDNVKESNEVNNALVQTVTFHEVPPLRVRVYGVEYPTGTLAPAIHETRLRSWLSRAYPTANVLYQPRTMKTNVKWPNDRCTCARDSDDDCGNTGFCPNTPNLVCDSDLDCGCERLNDMLTQMRSIDQSSNPGTFDADRRYVASVYDDGGFMRGCSPGNTRKVAAGPTGAGSFGWDFDGSYGDWYTGHELGHAFGREHAVCCGAKGDAVFPYDMCLIGESDNAVVGFDSGLQRVYAPDGPQPWTDIMSYCNNQWMSDYTYEAILDELVAEHGAPPPPPIHGNFALVMGSFNKGLGTAKITSVLSLPDSWGPPSPLTDGSGALAIELFDAAGAMVASHAFDAVEMEDDNDLIPSDVVDDGRSHARIATFAEIVPVPPGGMDRIAITDGGLEVASRSASAHAPTVLITAPAGGESVDTGFVVQWTAADLDGDALEFSLLYSTDAGSTWQALTTGLATTSVVFDRTGLAGGQQVLFRVIASDGFLAASDDSDAVVTVPDSAPQVRVLAPAGGAIIPALQKTSFEASADDPEDGDLAGASVVWTSDRQGQFGEGTSFVPLVPLAPGTHVVTVTATDSLGNTATDSITIVVGNVAADACDPAPRADCDSGPASLRVRSFANASDTRLGLRMSGNVDRDRSVFGDPTAATTQTVCIYESGLLLDAVAIAPSASDWRMLGSNGFALTRDGGTGIARALLKAGTAERPHPVKVALRGRGSALPMLALPLAVPVQVQLVNDQTTNCFGADFYSLASNGRGLLKARN